MDLSRRIRNIERRAIKLTSLVYGSTNTIPTGTTKTAVNMDEEIPKGAWLYLDSGIMKNFKESTDFFAINYNDGKALLDGDMTKVRDQIIDQFKSQEPNSEIEVTYLKIEWESAVMQPFAPYGFLFKGMRVIAVIKNVAAGLAPLAIAAILIGISILIPVIALTASIAWTAFKIVDAAENIVDDPLGSFGTISIGLIVFAGAAILLIVILGGGFKAKTGKHAIALKGRRV